MEAEHPIFSAIEAKNLEELKEILKTCDEICLNTIVSNDGEKPFTTAIYTKNKDIIEELLKAGAEVNYYYGDPEEQNTPLFRFCSWYGAGQNKPYIIEIIKLLLKYGANINLKGFEDQSVLEQSVSHYEGTIDQVFKDVIIEWANEHNIPLDTPSITLEELRKKERAANLLHVRKAIRSQVTVPGKGAKREQVLLPGQVAKIMQYSGHIPSNLRNLSVKNWQLHQRQQLRNKAVAEEAAAAAAGHGGGKRKTKKTKKTRKSRYTRK
jgi:ankyrin repeat protein